MIRSCLARVIEKNGSLESIMDQPECPFCRIELSRIHFSCEFTAAFSDAFPITDGHMLVVPKRHVASLFDLSEQEQAAVWKMVARVRAKLIVDQRVDGFNVGVNDGMAAGQTVMHAHVHVIPRRRGDVADPRGGVRWILPEKAVYWARKT